MLPITFHPPFRSFSLAAVVLSALSALCGLWIGGLPIRAAAASGVTSGSGSNGPISHVVIAGDPAATVAYIPRTQIVQRMVDAGLARYAGTRSAVQAWKSFVSPTNVIGFKVTAAPGSVSGTRLSVGEALIQSLIAAGHPLDRIIIWDKFQRDLDRAGWSDLARRLGVETAGAFDAGWDETEAFDYPLVGKPVFGELEFGNKGEGVGRKSHLSRLITRRIDRIVSIAPVLNHNLIGVNGHLAGTALASVDNTLRFESSASQLEERVVEIYNLPAIADRILFNVTDALIAQYRGEEQTMLHYAVALNQVRFSRDPVALDTLAMADIEAARARQPTLGERPVKTEFLNNAELLELGVAETNRIRKVYVQ